MTSITALLPMETLAQLAGTLNNLLLQIAQSTHDQARLNQLSDALQDFIDRAPPYANALVQVAATAITELNAALITNSVSAIQKLCTKAQAQIALVVKATSDAAAASAQAYVASAPSQHLAFVKEYVSSLPEPHPDILAQLDALAAAIQSLQQP